MKYYLVFLVSCSCLMLACSMSAISGLPKEAATPSTVLRAATPTVPAQVEAREVCAESLHVRDAPMGEVKGWLVKGQPVEVYSAVDGWSQVAAGKWRGLWVRESWLCEVDGE